MPQLAQLIDCIVNVVCHVSAVSPRVERKQGVSMLPQIEEWLVCCGEGEKEVQRVPTIEQPSCEKEKRGESEERRFGGTRSQPIGDSPLQRNNNHTRREY